MPELTLIQGSDTQALEDVVRQINEAGGVGGGGGGGVTAINAGDGIEVSGSGTVTVSNALFARRAIKASVTLTDAEPTADVAIPGHPGFFIRYAKQPDERTVSAQLVRNSGSFWVNLNATIHRATGVELKQRRAYTVGVGFPDWIDSYNAASNEAGQETYTRAVFESAAGPGATDITITLGGTTVGAVVVCTTFVNALEG